MNIQALSVIISKTPGLINNKHLAYAYWNAP